MANRARGSNDADASVRVADEELPVAMEYTLLKDMSVELKQFEELTSATSSGFAKVMSTHFGIISLLSKLKLSSTSIIYDKRKSAYRIQRSTMNSRLHHLNRRIVPNLDRCVRWQRHLR